MTIGKLVEYEGAPPEVEAVYDDIVATRKVDWVANFWKALTNDPASPRRVWEGIRAVMAPGALDPLTEEVLYVAVSVTNNCEYCIDSHIAGARKAGMSDAMLGELLAVVGVANQTNVLVNGYQVEVDERIRKAAQGG